jgi:hypothetical protein
LGTIGSYLFESDKGLPTDFIEHIFARIDKKQVEMIYHLALFEVNPWRSKPVAP